MTDEAEGPQPLSVALVLGQSSGGIGRHVKALAAGLADRGLAVRVCAPEASIDAVGLAELAVPVTAAPIGDARPTAMRATREVLRSVGGTSDLVHAHGLRAAADCVTFLSSRPLVVTLHNAPLRGSVWKLAHGALSRYVARGADLTLAASDDLAVDARRAGARMVRNTFVAAPPLPSPQRDPGELRAELGVGDRPVVLAVGRLQRQKRLDVLVDAATGWSDDDLAPVVLIAGEGPEQEALAAQARAAAAPVRLLGARRDVADLLAIATVVALPSEWEARALVAQEALRAGVPLVCAPVGGLPSLVGDAAALVPVGDAVALRAVLEALLHDPARRERLAAAGRARAATWPDESASIDQTVALYLNLMRSLRLR